MNLIMKNVKIRQNVFETNSSSTHSVCISKGSYEPSGNELDPSWDNYIHTEIGEFGWEFRKYYDIDSKISYIVTMIYETELGDKFDFSNKVSVEEINTAMLESPTFNELNEYIKMTFHCDGLYVDNTDGYIDHQSSTDDYANAKEFLDDAGVDSVVEFVFNPFICLRTGNDNSDQYWNDKNELCSRDDMGW